MPDLGPAIGGLLELFGPIIGAAVKALLRTVFGMVLLGAVVTVLTVYFAAQGSTLRGVIAAALTLVALAIVTGLLAVKNAVMRGLLHGVQKLGLGGRVLKLLFARLGAVGQMAERVPLRQAEERLQKAVGELLTASATTGGLRGWVSRKLIAASLERIASLTLARFRSEDAAGGGVDLVKVRDELAAVIDDKLAGTVAAKLNALNLLVAGLYVVFAVAIAVLLPRVVPG